jgi:peptidyl-prolyl cis-trans isomerase D
MLQTIHDKVTGWLAGIVLGAIAIVFVFWGINVRQSSGPSSYAAEVNGEKISLETARRAWQQRQVQLQQMMRSELPPEFVKSQQQALLDDLIRDRLLTARAEDLGYRASDASIAETITSAEVLKVDGKFSRDRYAIWLREQGKTEAQFEREFRAGLELSQLQTGVTASAFLTPVEFKRAQALQDEQREVEYAVVPLATYKDSVKLSDADIQSWYEKHPSDYMTTETADIEYLLLSLDDAAKDVKVDDESLKSFYEQNREKYETAERRHAHHILIKVGDGVDDATARKTAQTVADKVKAGEDFGALAKQYSKDQVSAAQGGDLGWAGKGMFVGPFEDALFSMKAGEVRGPIKTEFGYHVIRLDEIDAPHIKTLEEIRPELETEYRRDRAQSIFYDQSQKLADQSFSALTELQSVAKSLGLQLHEIKGLTRQGQNAGDLADSHEAIEAAFSEEVADKRHNSAMIAMGDDKALVLRVTNHRMPEQKPLPEVRSDIVARLTADAERAAAAKHGGEAIQQLDGGKAWSAVTTDLKVQPVARKFVGRKDTSVPAPALREAFAVSRTSISTTKPAYRGVQLENGDFALIAVSAVRPGDVVANEETKTAAQALTRDVGTGEFNAYVKQVEAKAKVSRNSTAFE